MSHVFITTKRIANTTLQFTRHGRKCLSYDIKNAFLINNMHRNDLRRFTLMKKFNGKYFGVPKLFSTLTTDEYSFEEDSNYEAFCHTDTDIKEKLDVRKLLYPDANDDIILKQLNNCHSIQNVFDVIRNDSQNLKSFHVCQSILVLFDLQKTFSQCYVQHLEKSDVERSPQAMVGEYVSELKSHQDFKNLLELVRKNYFLFNPEELSCAMFYLQKMGIDLDNSVMNMMMEFSHEKIIENIDDWSLLSLARYTSLFNTRDSLRFVNIAKDILPHMLKSLAICNSAENFRILTIGFHNIHTLLSIPVLQLFKCKTRELVDSGIICSGDVKCVLKILNFLNLPHWSKYNCEDIDVLCKLLKNSIHKMQPVEIISLHKIFQSFLSPAVIMVSIKERAIELLEQSKYDDRISTFVKLPDLLFCQVTASPLNKRQKFEDISENFLKYAFPSSQVPVYKILRYIKATNSQICDKYWEKTIDYVHTYNIDDYRLLRVFQKYMYFYSNINDVYRCRYFEREMMKKFLDLENSLTVMIPAKFARVAAFFIAYGFCQSNSPDYKFLNQIVSKLEEISGQLDYLSCLILSKGVHISSIVMNKKYLAPKTAHLLLRIDNILDDCTGKHIELDNLGITDLNIIFKTFINRRARFDSEKFYRLLEKYSQLTHKFSSRSIRDVSYNLLYSSIIVPSLYDRIIDYVAEQNGDLLGDTAQKILHLCYATAYYPKNKDYFQATINVIIRDKEIISGLTLLQACLALCYFGCLPDYLVKYVFSIEFMERLDEEIANCYSKMSYPSRVRKLLMNLNRCVCLELPQYDIPWFHEKYIQQRISSTPNTASGFHDEVFDVLCKVVGQKEVIKSNYFSPYGYKIDFLLQTDKNNILLPTASTIKDNSKSKIAILLLNSSCFCKVYEGDSENIESESMVQWVKSGPTKSRSRHLELMGFRVIEIPPSLWNSMHMSEPTEKINFLYDQIWK